MHAFVDESERPGRYLMCAVLVAPAHLTMVRRALTALCKPGQRRLHLNKERDPRRRLILDRIAALPIRANLYAQPGPATQARATCLRAITADLVRLRATRLVIEPVDGYDYRDRGDVIDELRRLGRLHDVVYEHVAAPLEPMLWAADAIAWGFGAGGDWRRRVRGLVDIHPGQRETRDPTVR